MEKAGEEIRNFGQNIYPRSLPPPIGLLVCVLGVLNSKYFLHKFPRFFLEMMYHPVCCVFLALWPSAATSSYFLISCFFVSYFIYFIYFCEAF